jgi:hypothetical protein
MKNFFYLDRINKMKYLIGVFLEYDTVKKFFPAVSSNVTKLTDELVACTSNSHMHRGNDLIPVGVFTEPLCFDDDGNLWTSNRIGPSEVKTLIDNLFGIDSSITYITWQED